MQLRFFSAIVVRGSVNALGNGATGETLVNYDIQTFISTLPGYTAQVLTFSLMIGFLIMIVAFVLGIFIYVLTIQKNQYVWRYEGARDF